MLCRAWSRGRGEAWCGAEPGDAARPGAGAEAVSAVRPGARPGAAGPGPGPLPGAGERQLLTAAGRWACVLTSRAGLSPHVNDLVRMKRGGAPSCRTY